MTWCLASYRGIVYYLHQGQPYQLYEGKEGELKAGSFREPRKNLMVALKASSSHKEVFIWRTALFWVDLKCSEWFGYHLWVM